MDISHVFVYGTLRQHGFREMPTLFPEATFIGASSVRGHLYDFGAYPGIRLDPQGPSVVGEIYAITPAILESLDEIEGYRSDDPDSYYFRSSIAVATDSGQSIDCWIYECNPRLYQLETVIESGDWIAHERARGYSVPEQWPDRA